MGYIDLHVHSTASDGSYAPSELVKLACEKGLYAFALTDHDTVAGIASAITASRLNPVRVIPGIELSSSIEGTQIHILGYHIDYNNPRFLEALKVISQFREERNIKICSQLRSYDIDIDYEEFRTSVGCRMITRDHFAAYLVASGYAEDLRDAYSKYLAVGKPCYVPMRRLGTRDAVRLITAAGGVAVVAHPVQYRLSDDEYRQLFILLRSYGVRGIEAIYSDNTMQDEQKFRHMAEELGMFITGGSDFHGLLKPDIDLGTGRGNLMIPQTLLNNIR